MFNIFKTTTKSKIKTLNKQYQRLLKEAYQLSTVNRRASSEKEAEADRILKEIESLEAEGND